MHEQPKPLTEFRSDLPKAFEHLTQKCLSKNRDDRYNSVNEILQQLLELNSGTSGGSANFENNTSKTIDQSVAVLEFNNITGDSLVDWLGEGISETVTVDLKKITAIKVISREKVLEILKNTSDKKLTEEKIIDIGKKLKTRWIVWGGFQKSGKVIRITAHFTEIMSGEILGSEKVDGNIEDIFKLQDSIITALAETLKLVLSPTEKKKIAKPETLELEAYEYYIKGRQLFNHFGKASFDEAQSFFEKAIEIDPKYALSYLGLGEIYIFRFIGQTDPHYLDLGISYLQKALEFDPDLTEVYNRLTYAYTRKYKFRDAIETGKKAIELKVDNYETHYFVGVAYMIKAASDYEISAYEIAIDYLLEAIQLQTNFEPTHEVISWIYLLKGRYSDAKMHLQKAIEIEELNLHEGVQFIGAYTLMGNLNYRLRNFDEALTNYNKSLQSLETSDHFYSKPLLAITYIGLGNISFYKKEFDKALQFFNKAQSVIVEYAKSIGMGYYIVLTYICLAKVFNKLVMIKEAKLYFQKALDSFNSKKGYDFNWIWEGSDAHDIL